MESILNNRPALAKEINKVAEVAGYLWQKGWAERNGGNITINITLFPIYRGYASSLKRMLFLLQGNKPPHARPSPMADGERISNSYTR